MQVTLNLARFPPAAVTLVTEYNNRSLSAFCLTQFSVCLEKQTLSFKISVDPSVHNGGRLLPDAGNKQTRHRCWHQTSVSRNFIVSSPDAEQFCFTVFLFSYTCRYRRLALKFHPNSNTEAGSAEKFTELGEAFDVLSDRECLRHRPVLNQLE